MFSWAQFVPMCYNSGSFQPDVFMGPVCPYVLAPVPLIVALLSLMYSWAQCVPVCYNSGSFQPDVFMGSVCPHVL
jgi:hypothetical protein